jgi:hypothetical protein
MMRRKYARKYTSFFSKYTKYSMTRVKLNSYRFIEGNDRNSS